ncbi:MerR family transcriptional regulator [Bacillus salinus]|uniref:MerR family transcriptional regulator n=1 Tax=Bacillus sp. HMF5848 TaxID=2495421 RepID=UPI00163A6DE4|nr:MerR family transcriptional regulator [Bacillus sp. HMF5848]
MGDERVYTIKEFATLTGVTVRTLQFYDRKGLLKPSQYNEKGHRRYESKDLYKLQKILTLKYLGFSLEDISTFLSEHMDSSLQNTLRVQKQLLLQKRAEIDYVINTITRVEEITQEDIDSDLLLSIIHSVQHEQAQKEILAKHTSDTHLINQLFMEDKTEDEKKEIERQLIKILKSFKDSYAKGVSTNSREVQKLVEQLVTCLNRVMPLEEQEVLANISIEEDMKFQFPYIDSDIEVYIQEAIKVYSAKVADTHE